MSMSEDVYKWLIAEFDSFQGGLTQDGFRAAYMYMFKSSGCDPETLWRDLTYMGYDRSLDLLYARTLILGFHSTVSLAGRLAGWQLGSQSGSQAGGRAGRQPFSGRGVWNVLGAIVLLLLVLLQ